MVNHLSLKGILFSSLPDPTGLNSGPGEPAAFKASSMPGHYNKYRALSIFILYLGNLLNNLSDWAMFPEAVFSRFLFDPWRRYPGEVAEWARSRAGCFIYVENKTNVMYQLLEAFQAALSSP
jgi:hypothetical protein